MIDPRDYLDAGADNMPVKSKNADAPGQKLLKDPSDSEDARYENMHSEGKDADDESSRQAKEDRSCGILEEDKEPKY